MCIITKNCKILNRNAKFRHICKYDNLSNGNITKQYCCNTSHVEHQKFLITGIFTQNILYNVWFNTLLYFLLTINKCPLFHWLNFYLTRMFLRQFLAKFQTLKQHCFLTPTYIKEDEEDGFLLIKGCVNTELDLEGM